MKKILLSTISAIMLMPMATSAQDDMYFVPTKENVNKASKEYGMPKDTYYCGSNRNVDEYNRRLRSTVEPINNDTTANDVISFDSIKGEYPDSLALMEQQEDYKYTRNMSRWDDYAVSNAYWNGYTDGRFNRWYGWSSFYDPWYYSSWYGWYDPWLYSSWYGGWYGPWHGGWYGGWYGWYDPWYYGWGGWYGPWYWGGPMIGHVSYGGFAGGKRYNNPGRIDASHGYVYGGSQGNNNTYTRRSGSNRSFGQRRENNGFSNNSNFGTRNNSSFGNSGSFGNGGSVGGGGSFGGGGASGGW